MQATFAPVLDAKDLETALFMSRLRLLFVLIHNYDAQTELSSHLYWFSLNGYSSNLCLKVFSPVGSKDVKQEVGVCWLCGAGLQEQFNKRNVMEAVSGRKYSLTNVHRQK